MKVINVHDETWTRLQEHASGFRGDPLGTPNKVIAHLLDEVAAAGETHESIETVSVPGWDEDGFHLRIETDEAVRGFRVTDTETGRQLLDELDANLAGLREWVAEHDRERAAYLVASPAERARVLGRALELDDPDAYEERAEALRDAADLARKAARES